MSIVTLNEKEYYIGNVSASKFYYKKDIFDYYNMSYLNPFLPNELIDRILSYICSSLIVYIKKKTIYYLNPRDKAIIKSIKLNKIKFDDNNTLAISDDGLTFYRIYRRHMELEYLCEEKPDNNKPRYKITGDSNRYYYSYNITKKCKVSAPLISKNFRMKTIFISNNGKYIVTCPKQKYFINKSNAYIAIYEAKTKTLVKEIQFKNTTIIEELSVSPNNNILIAIGYLYTDNDDHMGRLIKNNILVWNINTGEQLLNYEMQPFKIFNSKSIIWNPSSTKFACLCYLKEDKFILFGDLTDIKINIHKFQDKYINKTTWINDNQIACYSHSPDSTRHWAYSDSPDSKRIFIKNCKTLDEETIQPPDDCKLIYMFNKSMDGNIIIKYDKYIEQKEDESSESESSESENEPSENKDDNYKLDTPTSYVSVLDIIIRMNNLKTVF